MANQIGASAFQECQPHETEDKIIPSTVNNAVVELFFTVL